MGITLGNPIVITSGTLNTKITSEQICVERFYWLQPALGSTSSLILTKQSAAGVELLNLQVETSGVSQVFDLDGKWFKEPFCRCVPTGTLYIYLK